MGRSLSPTALPEIKSREVACGALYTAAIAWPVLRNGQAANGSPSLYMWGRVKAATQDSWMYPKTEDGVRLMR